MPIDVLLTQVAVSSVSPIVWNIIQDMTVYEATHGSEDPQEIRVFSKADPHVRPGTLTDEYRIEGLLLLTDTNGQNKIRTAYETRTTILLRILPDGVNGWYQPVLIPEYTDSAEADGDYVRVSFTARRNGAVVGVGTES